MCSLTVKKKMYLNKYNVIKKVDYLPCRWVISRILLSAALRQNKEENPHKHITPKFNFNLPKTLFSI